MLKRQVLVYSLIEMELISSLPPVKRKEGREATFRKLKRVSGDLEEVRQRKY